MKAFLERLKIDIPLDREPITRLIPWIVGFMIFLATLALIIAFLTGQTLGRWDQGLTGKWTIELANPKAIKGNDAPFLANGNLSPGLEEQLQAVFNQRSGIAATRILNRKQVERLLEPWIGKGNVTADLPLPILVDVDVTPHKKVDTKALIKDLQGLFESVLLQDHATWYTPVINLVRSIQLVALWATLLILAATCATIVFSMTINLLVHQDVVNVLLLIGAEANYIAKQFQIYALTLSFKAACIGMVPSLLILALFHFFSHKLNEQIPLDLDLSLMTWGIPFLVPFMVTCIVIITTRWSIMKALNKSNRVL